MAEFLSLIQQLDNPRIITTDRFTQPGQVIPGDDISQVIIAQIHQLFRIFVDKGHHIGQTAVRFKTINQAHLIGPQTGLDQVQTLVQRIWKVARHQGSEQRIINRLLCLDKGAGLACIIINLFE